MTNNVSSTLFVCDWGMQIKLTKDTLTEEMVYSISPEELHRKEVNIPQNVRLESLSTFLTKGSKLWRPD